MKKALAHIKEACEVSERLTIPVLEKKYFIKFLGENQKILIRYFFAMKQERINFCIVTYLIIKKKISLY